MDIEDLTIGQARKLVTLLGKGDDDAPEHLPFGVGDKIVIRTVTMAQVGVVRHIGRNFITLDDGGWVADTGLFGDMLAKGSICEFERAPSWILVARGAIVDAYPWAHAIPKESK